ncbi:RNA polymerase subunit sigma-70 [Amycolatopsis sp. FDAARGOS 1241]|uniref:RNA polymerase subunit sigma-70 n=1 Tax=Amycolatopsis sp. FDAARGOS 1241 TaxID=2778070 RepID=UPI0019507C10|nr:RNA polymerase subunit sigma-70 [Amycolatopsis sp. FDAARGOS 1241]QRP48450.1 RNA polymerase subunit sigma-70 [Amycolatopsis sp. FDAARGOS 1241]
MTSPAGPRAAVPDDEVAAALGGDQRAYAALVERHRAELHLHCYRFTASTQDAEDLVQETFLRAGAKRASFPGRSTFHAWLYGIATNACLDVLRRRPRRVTPPEVSGPADPSPARRRTSRGWSPTRTGSSRTSWRPESIPRRCWSGGRPTELAFLAAIQHLPQRQRAVLILRDVVGWPAAETAAALDVTVASVNSALQRARETLRRRWVRNDADRRAIARLGEVEQAMLAGMVDAWERTDVDEVAALLGARARLVMPPMTSWYDGRESITQFLASHAFTPGMTGHVRAMATAANRQPALGIYLRDANARFRPFALLVLTVEREVITELALFHLPRLFPLCGLPVEW